MTPPEVTPLDESEKLARSRRNMALGGALFLFVILVFVITIVRFYTNVHGR
jgi:hypothetical protein